MKRMMVVLALTISAGGCLHVKVDPVEVKPITLNVNLKVDRQLDEFFAFEHAAGSTTAPASQSSTEPVK